MNTIWITKTEQYSPYTTNGVARTLESYAHKRVTTGSSNDSFQSRPFSKLELLLNERIASRGSEFLHL